MWLSHVSAVIGLSGVFIGFLGLALGIFEMNTKLWIKLLSLGGLLFLLAITLEGVDNSKE